MADISMDMIKELKEKTGAGIVDCKKTLQETNGNMDEAVDILRKKGLAKAAKKEGRTAKEGSVRIIISDDNKKGLIVKVNCETDFVAKTEDFQKFVDAVTQLIFDKGYKKEEELQADLEEMRKNVIAKLGENILISEWSFIEATGSLYSYLHLGKVAAIVDFKGDLKSADGENFMKQVAMQITAMNPASVTEQEFPQDILNKEKEIYMEEAKGSGKPEAVVEKIALGKLSKFLKENVLLEQEFILDAEKKIKDLVADVSKALGTSAEIKSFIRIGL